MPTLTQTFLNDPNDKERGEKLVTRTFFSIGDDSQRAAKGNKVVAFRQEQDGSLKSQEHIASQEVLAKRVSKSLNKQKQHERKRLLINLFPYVDESKLRQNMTAECAIRNLWEDENTLTKNDISLNETALITKQKDKSFKQ